MANLIVMVIAATFVNATYERLPIEDEPVGEENIKICETIRTGHPETELNKLVIRTHIQPQHFL